MLYDPSNRESLRAWLVKTLEPICDAEPGALTDYVLALLEHDAPEQELRKEFIGQLEEFLEKGAADFVDSLFAALRSKSYLPYSSPSTSFRPAETQTLDTGIPIPLDALISPSVAGPPDRGRKRSLEHDDQDLRGPPKGPRLSTESQFPRYAQSNGHNVGGDRNWNHGSMDGRRDMSMQGHSVGGMGPVGMSMNGMMNGGMNGHLGHSAPRGNYQLQAGRLGSQDLPRRGSCRDYHNKGYCARGAMCKYSHDDAAVAPGQLPFQGGLPSMPMPGPNLPFMPLFNNGSMPFAMGASSQSPTYDPHEAHMDMRPGFSQGRQPPTRVPMTSRAQETNGEDHHMRDVQGELPVIQDLTPRRHTEDRMSIDQLRSNHAPQRDGMSDGPTEMQGSMGGDFGGQNSISDPMNGPNGISTGSQAMGHPAIGMRPTVGGNPAFRGGIRGGRGRGGTFTGDHQAFRSDHLRDKKTLVVEKIPEEHLSLEAVNGWFKRFGSVTNVAIDRSGAKALVSFSDHNEAEAAWKAEDAVFNNRFVKIFWHRPMEGQGGAGARMLQASAPAVASIASREATQPTTGSVPDAATPKPPATPTSATLTKKISAPSPNVSALAAKQQLLEKQIAEQKELMTRLDTASAEERKEIMSRLRKLGEEMKSTPTTTAAAPSTTPGPAPREDKERKAKELLDMELDMHAKTTAQKGTSANDKDGDVIESEESLEEKLARLRAEADALGITDTPGHLQQSPYRPYRGRGRGRGRGSYRGSQRGGAPRSSMRLDNRSKTLLLKVADPHDAAIVQALRQWFEPGGQVESLTVTDDDVVISFKSRAAAEQALAKGTNIPAVGNVKFSWHNPSSASKVVPANGTSNNSTQPLDTSKKQHVGSDDRPPSPRPEDMPDETGWGDGDEDGMGMF